MQSPDETKRQSIESLKVREEALEYLHQNGFKTINECRSKDKWKFQGNIEEIYTSICFLEWKIKKKNLVTRLKFICLIYIVTNVSTYFLNYYDIDYVL
mgnify:CR=1 FL=1